MYPVEFLVLPSCSHDVILGWDFLSRNRAIIDCARAQVEFDSPLDAPYADLQSTAPAKLTVAHDTDIPPRSAALVPLCCSSIPDAPVVFTPSPLFVHRKSLSLPFALLTVHAGTSAIVVNNESLEPLRLLHGEVLGCVEVVEPQLVTAVPDDFSSWVPVAGLSPAPSAPDLSPPDIGASIDPTLRSDQRVRLFF